MSVFAEARSYFKHSSRTWESVRDFLMTSFSGARVVSYSIWYICTKRPVAGTVLG
jgi:hypothetical protein